jgi:antitoxin YefM
MQGATSCTVGLYCCPEVRLSRRITYSHARASFADLWNEVESTREPAIIDRHGHEDMALIPAVELASLQETVHLLRSPRNAARLLSALARSRKEAAVTVELAEAQT